jgi:hypothetical protein
MQFKIQVLVPEASANEIANGVTTNSFLTAQTTASWRGFSMASDISAKCGGATVVFLDPPPPQVQLKDIRVSGELKLTQLGFDVNKFLGGIDKATAAGIRALGLPVQNINVNNVATMPYDIEFTVNCQPHDVRTPPPPAVPTEISIVVDVAVPPVSIDVDPMGAVITRNITSAARALLTGRSIKVPDPDPTHADFSHPLHPRPGMMTITIPNFVIDQVVANLESAWQSFWAKCAPLLNQAIIDLLGKLQIFQKSLALTMYTMPNLITAGGAELSIPPWDEWTPDHAGHAHVVANAGISAVNIGIKGVDITVNGPNFNDPSKRDLMILTFTLS